MARSVDIEDVSLSLERRVATACIASSAFLAGARSAVKPDLMESQYCAAVCRWCIDYYARHKEAPGRNIVDIAESRSKSLPKGDASELLEFLKALDRDWEAASHVNAGYLLARIAERCKKVAIERACESALDLARKGGLAEAVAAMDAYKRDAAAACQQGEDLVNSPEAFYQAFEGDDAKPVMRMPGHVGRLFNEHLIRGGFVMLQASQKAGKSWWLDEFARWGLKNGARVAFFGLGDMSQNQRVRRIGVGAAGRSDQQEHCMPHIDIVPDCARNQDGSCARLGRRKSKVALSYGRLNVLSSITSAGIALKDNPHYCPCAECMKDSPQDYEPGFFFVRTRRLPVLTWRDAYKKFRELAVFFKGAYRQAFASSMSIPEINAKLDEWEAVDGFVPDIVVTDYMDNIRADRASLIGRDAVNSVWKGFRDLTLDRNVLGVSATQADADASEAVTQSRMNFSEDNRKQNHVTLHVAINRTPKEAELGLMRFGTLIQREGHSSGAGCVVLQHLRRGRPNVCSLPLFYKQSREEDAKPRRAKT